MVLEVVVVVVLVVIVIGLFMVAAEEVHPVAEVVRQARIAVPRHPTSPSKQAISSRYTTMSRR